MCHVLTNPSPMPWPTISPANETEVVWGEDAGCGETNHCSSVATVQMQIGMSNILLCVFAFVSVRCVNHTL